MDKIEVELVWNAVILRLWDSIPTQGTKYQYIRCGTKASAHYLVIGTPPAGAPKNTLYGGWTNGQPQEYDTATYLARANKDSGGRAYFNSPSGVWNMDAKEALIKHVRSIMKTEYNELYAEHDLAERIAAKKRSKELDASRKIETRSQELTIPAQTSIAREAILGLLKQVVEEAGLSSVIQVETKLLHAQHGIVHVQVDPGKANVYLQGAYGGQLSTDKNILKSCPKTVDRSGEKLYKALVASGLPTEKVMDVLLKSDDPDCRRFAVMFGKPAVGLLDQDQKVRSIARRKVQLKVPSTIRKKETNVAVAEVSNDDQAKAD